MILEGYGIYSLICEECDMVEYFDTFDECIDYARNNGWRVYKNGWGDWEHRCPKCIQACKPTAKEDFDE